MNSCYRVEVNYRSKYFVDESEAFKYYLGKLKPNNSAELWFVSYQFHESIGRYIATQTLIDYYSIKKEDI